MRLLRGLAGGLLWIVAGLLGLVSLLLCVTIILLPLGIPLLGLARRMMGTAIRLMLPRVLAHPVEETKRGLLSRKDKAKSSAKDAGDGTTKKGRKASEALGDAADKASKKHQEEGPEGAAQVVAVTRARPEALSPSASPGA